MRFSINMGSVESGSERLLKSRARSKEAGEAVPTPKALKKSIPAHGVCGLNSVAAAPCQGQQGEDGEG